MESFAARLTNAVTIKGNAVCVGLDPRADLLPSSVHGKSCEVIAAAYEEFCCRIIDTVSGLVPVVKPQAAFFEALGPDGCTALRNVNRYAQQNGLLVVMDAKRGDIGSTAEAYAEAYLSGTDSPWKSDALTVNPFLGDDTLAPYVERCDAHGTGIFVLVKTSNPGSAFIQQSMRNNQDISSQLANWIQSENERLFATAKSGCVAFGSIGAVVGATYPEELERLRARMPSSWLLIPGYGAQGGSSEDLKFAWNSDGSGAIVNSSRGIIFAYRNASATGHDWLGHVRAATIAMIEDLNRVRLG